METLKLTESLKNSIRKNESFYEMEVYFYGFKKKQQRYLKMKWHRNVLNMMATPL